MSKEKILELDRKLSDQRTNWSNKIKELAKGLKNINQMETVISEVLSTRQILVDNIAYINVKIKEQKWKALNKVK